MRRPWAVLAGVVFVGVTGCGNRITTETVGLVGVLPGLRLVVAPCRAELDRLTIYDVVDRSTGGEERTNSILAEWRAQTPHTETFELPLSDPPAGWTASQRIDLRSQPAWIAIVSSSTADREAAPVAVTEAAYASLGEDQVLVREGEVWTRAEFEARACDRAQWPPVTSTG